LPGNWVLPGGTLSRVRISVYFFATLAFPLLFARSFFQLPSNSGLCTLPGSGVQCRPFLFCVPHFCFSALLGRSSSKNLMHFLFFPLASYLLHLSLLPVSSFLVALEPVPSRCNTSHDGFGFFFSFVAFPDHLA